MTAKNKNLLIFSTFALIILLIIVFVIIPVRSSVTTTSQNIDDRKANLEITKKKVENVSALKQDFENIEKRKDIIDGMFITEKDQLTLFKDLENISVANNLKLEFTLDTSSSNASEVGLNVNLEGDYLNILKYVANLEAVSYYIKVISFDILRNENTHNVKANIQAKTYWE